MPIGICENAKEGSGMRISDGEIEKSLRLLSQPPLACGREAAVDRRLQRLVLDRMRLVPEVRTELVRPLKEAVEENRYLVSGEKVAHMMLGRLVADSLR